MSKIKYTYCVEPFLFMIDGKGGWELRGTRPFPVNFSQPNNAFGKFFYAGLKIGSHLAGAVNVEIKIAEK